MIVTATTDGALEAITVDQNEATKPVQAGDEPAFRTMFEANQTLVFNVCWRMLGDRHEAEDLTQEVFFRAYKSLRQLRGEAKASTWLYRIAVNLCLNHQQRRKRERWLSLDWLFETQGESASSLPVNEATPRSALEESERLAVVRAAINALSAKQRAALVLSVYERLSYQEIAAVMQCSLASVESRVHRAKENLARQLLARLG